MCFVGLGGDRSVFSFPSDGVARVYTANTERIAAADIMAVSEESSSEERTGEGEGERDREREGKQYL